APQLEPARSEKRGCAGPIGEPIPFTGQLVLEREALLRDKHRPLAQGRASSSASPATVAIRSTSRGRSSWWTGKPTVRLRRRSRASKRPGSTSGCPNDQKSNALIPAVLSRRRILSLSSLSTGNTNGEAPAGSSAKGGGTQALSRVSNAW